MYLVVMICQSHVHRLSEPAESSRAHRRLDMEPETPLDWSPQLTPRSTHAAPSDEDEEEPPRARRKKTGDETPSRERLAQEEANFMGKAEGQLAE